MARNVMNKPPKFTFKKVISTGRYRSFEREQHVIKLNRKEVGRIYEEQYPKDYNHRYAITLAVEKERTDDEPADFRWILLKARFATAQDARDFLSRNCGALNDKYRLHRFED